jgi:hypothetical protein
MLDKVSFDNKNIIYVHPKYLKKEKHDDKSRIKYVLWSIGILILKYIYFVPQENLIYFHKNYKRYSSMLKMFKINPGQYEFLKQCFSYEEENFIKFFIM